MSELTAMEQMQAAIDDAVVISVDENPPVDETVVEEAAPGVADPALEDETPAEEVTPPVETPPVEDKTDWRATAQSNAKALEDLRAEMEALRKPDEKPDEGDWIDKLLGEGDENPESNPLEERIAAIEALQKQRIHREQVRITADTIESLTKSYTKVPQKVLEQAAIQYKGIDLRLVAERYQADVEAIEKRAIEEYIAKNPHQSPQTDKTKPAAPPRPKAGSGADGHREDKNGSTSAIRMLRERMGLSND